MDGNLAMDKNAFESESENSIKQQLEIDAISNALHESEKERIELIEKLYNIKKQLQEQVDECYNQTVKSVCKSIIEDNF